MNKVKNCLKMDRTDRLCGSFYKEKCLCKEFERDNQWTPLVAKQTNYCKKVLIGNWFEDSCDYKKNKYNHKSEYECQYGEKPNTTHPRSVIWDTTLKNQSHDVICGNEPDKSTGSYMSSYYLSYQLLPLLAHNKEIKLPNHPRVGRMPKHEEQFKNYGNQCNYGLGQYKKSIWEFEQNDPRKTAETINESVYPKPTNEYYTFYRWIRRKPQKGKYGDEYVPVPPNHPRLSKCNPLTWNC
ncbi:unnamed protein product [Diabrotica balteata]|uniref:Uncharacterized protein n=1 Tax=Diabrotica balteata TaxID=107213 RepID=A0A9N9T2Y2_DIABA|nr:unnamed protein product [Diabrotica balteata]